MNQSLKALLAIVLLLISVPLGAEQKQHSDPEIRTSVQLNILSANGIVRLKNAITSFFTSHGFPDERDGFLPEYRKSLESRGQFAIDLYSTTGAHIFVEGASGCLLVHMQGPRKEHDYLVSLKEEFNKALAKQFREEVKIYPDDVCGSAGFTYP
ncbi:MAG: hypothetical protein KGJ20_08060 [Gammaproteobacteria bacterium]|nr:hypothetical protein [Gammaproteobacteria bacterium]